jgi:hypothetical protein
MRNELGMDDSARPPDNFNAFEGTDLEKRFRSKERRPAIG